MVTGGESSYGVFIDTTEVYDSDLGIWAIFGAKLPRPMAGLRATNIDGRVMILLYFSYHLLSRESQQHYYDVYFFSC